MMITTNDLKKGDTVRLCNGWTATIADNKKGNIRLAEVQGFCTEIGSIYAHDILTRLDTPDGQGMAAIQHTEAQIKLRRQMRALGM